MLCSSHVYPAKLECLVCACSPKPSFISVCVAHVAQPVAVPGKHLNVNSTQALSVFCRPRPPRLRVFPSHQMTLALSYQAPASHRPRSTFDDLIDHSSAYGDAYLELDPAIDVEPRRSARSRSLIVEEDQWGVHVAVEDMAGYDHVSVSADGSVLVVHATRDDEAGWTRKTVVLPAMVIASHKIRSIVRGGTLHVTVPTEAFSPEYATTRLTL